MDLTIPRIIPVKIPLYLTTIVLIYGDDFKQFDEWIDQDFQSGNNNKDRKILKKMLKGFKSDFDKFSGKYITRKHHRIIYIKEHKDPAEFISVLNHEIFHAAHDVTKHVGIELTDSSEEAYAYLIGYLTKEFLTPFYEENETMENETREVEKGEFLDNEESRKIKNNDNSTRS